MLVRAVLIVALCLGATVSTNPFCIGAVHAQQEPQMPPEGAYCDHSRSPAHACACHAVCVEDPDGKVTLQEDGQHCRAFCFKKHCHCPADNCQAPASARADRVQVLESAQVDVAVHQRR